RTTNTDMVTAMARPLGRTCLQSRNDLPPLYQNAAHGRSDGELWLRAGSPQSLDVCDGPADPDSADRPSEPLGRLSPAPALGDRHLSDTETLFSSPMCRT